MDKALIAKLRDFSEKHDLPLILYCDNEHIFYHNTKDQFPIIWDDATESFTSFRVAIDPYT